MSDKCSKCKGTLQPWSKFKDLKKKEGVGLALCSSVINVIDHFWLGENRSRNKNPDFRTLNLYYCPNCKSYYLRCPGCKTFNRLTEMPNETRTIVVCYSCHKNILYAENDYSMGG